MVTRTRLAFQQAHSGEHALRASWTCNTEGDVAAGWEILRMARDGVLYTQSLFGIYHGGRWAIDSTGV